MPWSQWVGVACVGAQTLLAYNAMLNTQPFFDEVFDGLGFPFTSMICYSGPICATQAYMTWIGDAYTGDSSTFGRRMRLGFCGMLISCVLFVVVTLVASVNKSLVYIMCLCNILLLSVTSAVTTSALMGYCALTAPSLAAAAMFGLGFSGLLTFTLSELLTAAGLDAMVMTASLFVFCTLFTLVSAWVCQRCLLAGVRGPSFLQERSRPDGGVDQEIPHPAAGAAGAIHVDATLVVKDVLPQAINIFAVFVVTLSVFPGVVVGWAPGADSPFSHAAFTTLVIGIFQVFDVVGRYCAGPLANFIPARLLVCLVCARLVFVPLFVVAQRYPDTWWLCGSDLGRCLLMTLFAGSNGFAGSCSMMFGPMLVSKDSRETAGKAMSCCMAMGLFLGCLLAPLTQIR